MKLKFKVQPYQTNAVNDVVDCFAGQPMISGLTYRIDPGRKAQSSAFEEGFKNADFALTDAQILENIQKVQRRQNLPVSQSLTDFTTFNARGERVPVAATYKRDALAATRVHLDVEMETGTGKTYCYIKTIFEMNKRYGWSKFIIMVPSIAIREGVYKSLQITADHFTESYGKKARFFIYNSKRLHELESFSSDAGINVMIINIQAFNARGADNRRIYEELDDFQSRKPIDVIASNRPILILDEPQKMEGKATMEALPKFKPLFIMRYSATHRTQHNRVHRLDALDAYSQKLVKKIAVRGIQTRGLAGTNAYLYLEGIDISKKAPVARVEIEVKLKSGEIKRQLRRLEFRDDLFVESGELDQYDGLFAAADDQVSDVTRRDAITDEGLAHFQAAYPGEEISKEDLFYYIYGLLHSPDYRERFKNNLAKQLPRIPAVKSFADFAAFRDAGRALGHLHVNFESVEPYMITFKEGDHRLIPEAQADPVKFYRVKKMKLGGKGKTKDRTTVIYNDSITMQNIPLEAWDYVVNGKAALDWVMERQVVKTDKASGIVNDANDYANETVGNPRYPLELFQRVITVSLETMKIVNGLPNLELGDSIKA